MAVNESMKLLVVDDEKGIVDYTTKIYSRKGFRTFGAYDGVSALEIFRKEKPDICLIDIHMPFSQIDGLETLKRIKELDKDVSCIMVTRMTDNASVEKSREMGAAAYVTKPLRLDDLNSVLLQVMQEKQKKEKISHD